MLSSKHEKAVKEISRIYSQNKPFEHVAIKNLLDEKEVSKLSEQLKEDYYYLEDHDLYQFFRTVDFKNLEENKTIKGFREFILSKKFIDFVEKITNEKVKKGVVELHSLRMLNTNYLLCHDDQVEDRKLAFILYISEDLDEGNGGQLEFFDVDSKNMPVNISKKISPKFNQFVIFKVSDKSYHQISEIVGNVERKSISGWFY